MEDKVCCATRHDGGLGTWTGSLWFLTSYLIRVPYDIELAIKQARDEQMPDLEPYENELRTARYRETMPPAQEHDRNPNATRG